MKGIEDDQVMLSAYKASRFVKPFAREVDRWERDISRILEITESLMNVQKQWLYLEVCVYSFFLFVYVDICKIHTSPQIKNIFAGEDIRTQLPKETTEFEHLNGMWKSIMGRIINDPNAYRVTNYEGKLHLKYENGNLNIICSLRV